MPRARRYIAAGHTYHVTHRCHNRAFLLRYARDRTTYRQMLRDQLTDSQIRLFSYCVTCNHVHLLLRPDPDEALERLSGLMQRLEGEFARSYNRRKRRANAFWGDRYHATMVESGNHLWRCLVYIDMNMVRAGAVKHPREWAWTGYQELMGIRKRYRVVDVETLVEHLGASSKQAFREGYEDRVNQALLQRELERDPMWTESLAVGSEDYVRALGKGIGNRMSVETVRDERDRSRWVLRETRPQQIAYGPFSDTNNAAKPSNPGVPLP